MSRCDAHGRPVAEYTLPFETELGLRPTMEAMQEHIVTNKKRPPIHDHWRDHSVCAVSHEQRNTVYKIQIEAKSLINRYFIRFRA